MIINSPRNLITDKKSSNYVFLGGPIQGAPNWQETLPNVSGITWISPRRTDKVGSLSNDDWIRQVEWETEGIRISDVLLFWVPLNISDIPGRDYAQTTRMELLENLARGKKIIIGIEEGVHAKRYMSYKSIFYGVSKIHNSLEGCLEELYEYIKIRDDENKIFFTSDTHFGSERSLKLSKRPFSSVDEMNMSMVERWNKIVPTKATVYHLGDFGDRSFCKYLNGDINLILGNYERKELSESKDLDIVDFMYKLKEQGFNKVFLDHELFYSENFGNLLLVHEPSKSKIINDSFKYYLYGHIHEKQKIKHSGVNVSVDCNNFYPISLEDVEFYLNALDKNFYDNEVFLQ